MRDRFDFHGKTALVTGASSGIGRAFAYALAKRGARLLLVARSRDKLHDLAAELRRDYACDADFLTVDLSTADAVHTIDCHLKVTGKVVDVLVNNAGFAAYGRFETIPWTRQRDEVLVNCMAAIELTHLLLPGMQARSAGAVINVASTAAFQPDPYMAVYGATKAFVRQFSLNLRADLLGTPLRVTDVEPGLCGGTEFSNVRYRGDDAKAANVYNNVQPLMPEDIADAIYWIATRPAHVNVNTIELMPVAQAPGGPTVHRG